MRYARTLLSALALLVMAGDTANTGQESTQLGALFASQVEVDRLAPGTISGQASFTVDESDVVTILLVSTVALDTFVETPSGETLDETSIGTFGGQFTSFQASGGGSGLIIIPGAVPGFRYEFTFPTFGPGNYIVQFAADSSLTQEAAVLTQLFTDSPIRATLVATESVIELGDAVAVSAFVFEEDSPVADAIVSVVVRPETGEPVTLDLLDDGIGADGNAGDGLYSAPVFPTSTGKYSVAGIINGLTAGGVPFEREVAAGFEVISPQGRIVSIVDDRAVDDDVDGVFDRVTVDVAVEIFTGGTFDLLIQLLTNDDRRLTRKSESILLAPGTQTITVSFESVGIVSTGVDGPYEMNIIEMQHLDNDVATTIDRQTAIGTTRGYTISQFQTLQKGSISGTVTEQDTGVPLGDVAVFIYDINGDEVAQVTTNASGQYLVENVLQPGTYRATTQNTLSFIDEIYDNIRCAGPCGSPDRNGTPILVEAGLETTSTNFALTN